MTRSSGNMTGLALGGLIALAVGLGISRFVFTPILPFMETGLGLSKSDAGLIASANFLGYLLGAFLAIKQSLPGSARRWFLSSLIVCALTTIAMGLTTSFGFFLFLRLAGGIGSAFVMVFGSTLILARLATDGRPGLSALHFAGVGTGIAVSSILIVVLAAAGVGWQGLWIWSGGLSLLLLVPVFLLVPEGAETSAAVEAPPKLSYSRPLKALILSYFLLGFGYIITATFISALVRQIPDLQWMQSLIWLVVGIAAIPSVAFWTWIGTRVGNHNSYAIASLCLAVGVAGSVLGKSEFILLASAVLLGGTFMGMTALGLVNARAELPDNARQILAIMTLSFGLGQTVGPAFAGFAFGIFGNFVAASLTASAGLVIAALLVVFIRARPVLEYPS